MFKKGLNFIINFTEMSVTIIKSALFSLFISFIAFSCGRNASQDIDREESIGIEMKDLDHLSKAYFASGCFWCVEAVYESVFGVEEVISGYSGGKTDNPTYNSIGTGTTGHAESVEVIYDPSKVNYNTLLKVFFGSGDPTTINRQGPDSGTQYRSIIFYQNEDEMEAAKSMIAKLSQENAFEDPIVTEVVPFEKFYPAEDYHQNYERRNPNNRYVRAVSIPRLNRFKAAFPELLKENQEP